MTASHGN